MYKIYIQEIKIIQISLLSEYWSFYHCAILYNDYLYIYTFFTDYLKKFLIEKYIWNIRSMLFSNFYYHFRAIN